jgi:hypothetical protein
MNHHLLKNHKMETKHKDKRKVLLMVPLLVMPFLALAFYAMGGGRSDSPQLLNQSQKGINTDLPDAAFKKGHPQDKLAYYQQADQDSASSDENGIKSVADRLGFSDQEQDPQAELINEKLQALNKELSRPAEANEQKPSSATRRSNQSVTLENDVDRLEALMLNMQQSNADDPEIRQLNGMLEKILDIQHPQRVSNQYINKISENGESLFKAIPAVIEENQKVTEGSVIKVRLLDTIILSGQIIPKNHLIYGICDISNQRLTLDIKNIRLGNSIVPVDLSVFDMDGMKGINVPEALTNDFVKEASDDALRSIQLMTMDQSITTQVAGAGIDAAKSLLGKKAKRIKVKLQAGHQVLLRNNKPDQNH